MADVGFAIGARRAIIKYPRFGAALGLHDLMRDLLSLPKVLDILI